MVKAVKYMVKLLFESAVSAGVGLAIQHIFL